MLLLLNKSQRITWLIGYITISAARVLRLAKQVGTDSKSQYLYVYNWASHTASLHWYAKLAPSMIYTECNADNVQHVYICIYIYANVIQTHIGPLLVCPTFMGPCHKQANKIKQAWITIKYKHTYIHKSILCYLRNRTHARTSSYIHACVHNKCEPRTSKIFH